MKAVFFLIALLVSASTLLAEGKPKTSDSVVLRFPNSSLDDLLRIYALLTHRELHVVAGVGGTISLMAETPRSRAEAITLIYRTLLEQYGIEIRHVGEHRADVIWTANPAYLRGGEIAPSGARHRTRIVGASTPEIDISKERVIKPEDARKQ